MENITLLFPGQGSQVVGMVRDLAEAHPECRALFDQAGKVLGCDLARITFDGPMDELTKSCHAQPAIFTASVACLTALRKARPDVTFTAAAGLSSGEWTALHWAGVVSFEDTLRILEVRGKAMQRACELQPGGMLSVLGSEMTVLQKVAAQAGVELANFNSPEQTVLSGPLPGIEMAENLLKEAGVRKTIRLNVSGAFHSSLMAPAAKVLEDFVTQIALQTPQNPVLSNVTAQPHTTPDEIRRLMVRQVTNPVRWVECIQGLKALGVRRYVECGPGKVLTGLLRRIDKEAVFNNISDVSTLGAFCAAQVG